MNPWPQDLCLTFWLTIAVQGGLPSNCWAGVTSMRFSFLQVLALKWTPYVRAKKTVITCGCCGVAVQSRERQLMKIWQKSLRSWRITRTWIVAFFFLQKIPDDREDVDCKRLDAYRTNSKDVTELDLSHNKIKDAGVQATFLMTWCYYMLCVFGEIPYWATHRSQIRMRPGTGSCSCCWCSTQTARTQVVQETLGWRTQLVFMGSQEQRNQRKSDSVMWGGCMTHSENSVSKLFVVSITVTPSHLSCAVMNSGSWQRRCSRRAFQFSEKTWRLGWFH